jgi:hypothetical protein
MEIKIPQPAPGKVVGFAQVIRAQDKKTVTEAQRGDHARNRNS